MELLQCRRIFRLKSRPQWRLLSTKVFVSGDYSHQKRRLYNVSYVTGNGDYTAYSCSRRCVYEALGVARGPRTQRGVEKLTIVLTVGYAIGTNIEWSFMFSKMWMWLNMRCQKIRRCAVSSSKCTRIRFRPELRPGPRWRKLPHSRWLAGEGTPPPHAFPPLTPSVSASRLLGS